MYGRYGLAFYGESEWCFDNDSGSNVITFGVHNSSSSHTDNQKNDYFCFR